MFGSFKEMSPSTKTAFVVLGVIGAFGVVAAQMKDRTSERNEPHHPHMLHAQGQYDVGREP